MSEQVDPSSAATAAEGAPVDAGASPMSEPPVQGAPPPEGVPAEAGTNLEGTGDDGSLTTGDGGTPVIDPPDGDQDTQQEGQGGEPNLEDLREQYRSLESRFGRSQRELHETRQQLQAWNGLDPEQVRQQLEQQRQEAERRNLRPYNRKHPDHQATMAKFSVIEEAQRALAEAGDNEELQRFVNRHYAGRFTEEDVRAYRDYQGYRDQIQQELVSDPDEFVRGRVEEVVINYLEQYQQLQDARADSTQWLSKNEKLLQTHADDIRFAMTHPNRRDVGLALAQAKAEIAELRRQLIQGEETVSSAQAQRQAFERGATVQRDGRSVPAGDPVAAAREKGLQGAALAEYLLQNRGVA